MKKVFIISLAGISLLFAQSRNSGTTVTSVTTTTTSTTNVGRTNTTTSESRPSAGVTITTNTTTNSNNNTWGNSTWNNNNGWNGTWNNNNGWNGTWNNNNNGWNGSWNNNGWDNGTWNNNGTHNNNSNWNSNNNQNNEVYVPTNDYSYGSSVIVENNDGSTTTIIDSTQRNVTNNNTNNTNFVENTILRRIEEKKVHFSGLVMSDIFWDSNTSQAYMSDGYSEFLGPGKYDRIGNYLPLACRYTFDGIAVPPGTRLVIYSKQNFQGDVLVDVTGPAIINNVKWIDDERYEPANSKNYIPVLQSTFPQNVRQWSYNNMHNWQNGSIEIIAQ